MGLTYFPQVPSRNPGARAASRAPRRAAGPGAAARRLHVRLVREQAAAPGPCVLRGPLRGRLRTTDQRIGVADRSTPAPDDDETIAWSLPIVRGPHRRNPSS